MLSMLSVDKTSWPVYLSIGNLSKAKRRSVKMNRLILIGLLPKCPHGPKTHTNRFAYPESIATILRTLEEPAKSRLGVLCADGRTRHAFPRIASFLADYPEQCTIRMVRNGWCPRCEICPDDMPGFALRPRRHHPQRYLHLSTKAAEEVGLWKFADCPNFADAPAGCNIYSCMNVDRLHQLLKGLLKDHTWEWIVSFLKDIYGQEKGLDLIEERFSIIPRFSNIRRLGDTLTHVKQWTGAQYKDMVKVWLAAFAPLLKGHPDHFKFIKSVTYFILITSYHSRTKTTLKYLQDALSGISSNIHLFLPYRKSHRMSNIPNIDSLLHYIECIREMGSADNSDTEISEAGHKILIKDGYRSCNKVNYIPQMLLWETRLFHIKSRVSIILHIVKLHLLPPKADIFRKLLAGDSLASDTLSPGLIPRINGVMSKRNTIATLIFPERISISEFIDALTSYFSTFQADTSASLDLRTSGSCASWILRQKIYRANGVTVTIQQHNHPDTVVVQKARCVEKWRGQGNRFDNIVIQGE